MRPNDPNHPNYFTNFEYLVEATHNEQQFLWVMWAKEAADWGYTSSLKVPWDGDSTSWFGTIGHLNKRPITVTISGVTINGHRVAFYEANSELVDWKMIEEWAKKTFPQLFMSDKRLTCDAANFHHCLHFVRNPS